MSDCMDNLCGLSGHLCSSCAKDKRIAELESNEKRRLAKYMAALDSINELEAQLAKLEAKYDASLTFNVIAERKQLATEAQLDKVRYECRVTSDDYAPDSMPFEVADVVGRIEQALQEKGD